ncbi:hypothetical protein K435DRAFT_965081 [Dendrothele bispora CBS 962.96]|uniref:Phorbol-ester/DAG-type domain-containing protein n=1 Tax=Dendrothele bispora (strain CBS 962.96) TaxID=1314807 RepID=A0A4S8M737_DENBC|nr:hypothetical protein K435DRAFT_965081 [Dendrothele bispora CBS 962.96]
MQESWLASERAKSSLPADRHCVQDRNTWSMLVVTSVCVFVSGAVVRDAPPMTPESMCSLRDASVVGLPVVMMKSDSRRKDRFAGRREDVTSDKVEGTRKRVEVEEGRFVCLLNVKRSAVLCEQCSLICHSKCAINAPPTCDLRAQLLLYAQYAEKGNPGSAYSNPADAFGDVHPKSPMSDVPFVSHTPRTSLDTSPPIPIPIPHPSFAHGIPPTAFKSNKSMGAFKQPRHHADSQTSISSSPPREIVRKPTVLRKNDGRPQSLGSSSTNPHSSVRSGGTVASAGQRSTVSDALSSAIGESIVRTGVSEVHGREGHHDIPEEIVDHSHRHRKNKSSNNCIVQ